MLIIKFLIAIVFSIGLFLVALVGFHMPKVFTDYLEIEAYPTSINIVKFKSSGKYSSRPSWVPSLAATYNWNGQIYEYQGYADSRLFPNQHFNSEKLAKSFVAVRIKEGKLRSYIHPDEPGRLYLTKPSFNTAAAVSLIAGLFVCSFSIWALLNLNPSSKPRVPPQV